MLNQLLSFKSLFQLSYQKHLLLLLVISSFTSLSCLAIEVENLYQTKVQVEDKSNTHLWKAALVGFKEILVRNSGSKQVLDAHEIQQAYRKVTSYLQSYEYILKASEEGGLQTQSQLELLLYFDSQLIDKLIRGANQSIWGSNRPVTMMWLAIEEKTRRKIIKEESQLRGRSKSLSEALNHAAKRRGIPVILPLMDLEDRNAVSLSDIWGMFSSPVEQASQRYSADSIVGGRIRQIGNVWHAKAFYSNAGEEQNIELKSSNLEGLLNHLIDNISELLCQKYCVFEYSESNHVVVQVSNMTNYANLKMIRKDLENLASIRRVEISKVSTDSVQFNISLLGDINMVKAGIKLNGKLVEDSVPQNDPFKDLMPVGNMSESLSLDNENNNNDSAVVESLNETNSESLNQLDDFDLDGLNLDESDLDKFDVSKSNVNKSDMNIIEAKKEEKTKVILYYRWAG